MKGPATIMKKNPSKRRKQSDDVPLEQLLMRVPRDGLERLIANCVSNAVVPTREDVEALLPARLLVAQVAPVQVVGGVKPVFNANGNSGLFAGVPTDLMLKIIVGLPFREKISFCTRGGDFYFSPFSF